MPENITLINTIALIGIVVLLASSIWYTLKPKPQITKLNKALNYLMYITVLFGLICMGMFIFLPTAFSHTYLLQPANASAMSNAELVRLLQQTNETLVGTNRVLRYFIFFFGLSFLPAVFVVAQRLRERNL